MDEYEPATDNDGAPNGGPSEQNPASLPPPASEDEEAPRAAARDGQGAPSAKPAAQVADEYADLAGDADPVFDPGIERVLEIPLTIHVELGRKKMKIRELLQVGAGAVVPLETQAGSPLSIYANNTLIAEGEAVVVGERYGVRVTDIVSPAERVKRLGGES